MNYLKSKIDAEKGGGKALQGHLWALCLLLLMILLEIVTPATISPLMSMMAFGIFANRMRPGVVAFWVLIFSFTTLLFLTEPWLPTHPHDDTMTAWIRFGTIFIGGMGAVVLSFDRSRIAEGFLQMISVLEKLPTPVIIADSQGSIVFMNNGALKLLDATAEEVRGASYFSFVADAEKGRTVQRYLDFVDSKEPVLHNVYLKIQKPKPMEVHATLVSIEGNQIKLVATVFSETSDAFTQKTTKLQAIF